MRDVFAISALRAVGSDEAVIPGWGDGGVAECDSDPEYTFDGTLFLRNTMPALLKMILGDRFNRALENLHEEETVCNEKN